jgi:alkylation response protein AidB-like acyl-CoA dehydrogenase
VDFELSDDQVALQEAARALLDDLAAPARIRAHLASGEPYDTGLWSAMLDQGWLVVELPEADGGLGMTFVEAMVLAEQVGRHVAPAPFHQTLLALAATRDTPWADRILEGALACVAWRGPLTTAADARAGDGTHVAAGGAGSVDAVAGSRAGGVGGATSATAAFAGGSAGGGAVLVPYAPVADLAVVASDDGVVVHDLREGPAVAAEPAMDLTRCVGWIPADYPVAGEVGGPEAAVELLDRGATATGAETLGAADRVLEMAVAYAKERVQFGKPIGSFQAVKHRCADMLVDVEGMRSTVYHAAWSLAAGDPGATVAASTAKVWCADAGRRVMSSGLQVHGGIGFTWEHDLHLFLKRAQLDQVTFGDAPAHRERLAIHLRAALTTGAPIV